MKLPILIIFTILFSAFQPVSAESTSRVEIRNGDKIAASIGDLRGRLQVRADKSTPGDKPGSFILRGNVRITTSQNGRKTVHIRADEALVESNDIEVQVYDYIYAEEMKHWYNQLSDFGPVPSAPLYAFSEALKAHPKIPFFRMKFEMLLAGFSDSSIVFYDRNKGTLKIENRSSGNGEVRKRSTIFGGISDATIQKLLNSIKPQEDGSTDGYFGRLDKFGGKVLNLESR